jgi:hypothetical protein
MCKCNIECRGVRQLRRGLCAIKTIDRAPAGWTKTLQAARCSDQLVCRFHDTAVINDETKINNHRKGISA